MCVLLFFCLLWSLSYNKICTGLLFCYCTFYRLCLALSRLSDLVGCLVLSIFDVFHVGYVLVWTEDLSLLFSVFVVFLLFYSCCLSGLLLLNCVLESCCMWALLYALFL